ncbi:MAG: tRNA guanosine(34) transglycosylase Tgt [Patescibacteria group bacterium]
MPFSLIKKLESAVRVGELTIPHGLIRTPFFMPVGTAGSVKGVAPRELKELGAEIILANTYHLYLRPGERLIKKLGGLHSFMRWDKPILTDSGGYQVFSLAKNSSQASGLRPQADGLVQICDDGVEFTSHLDGSKHFFTPERVIDIQLDLGVDILMPLDVCPSGKATPEEIKRATQLTIEWAKRAKKHFLARAQGPRLNGQASSLRPLLFAIVQGGLDLTLRQECAAALAEIGFDGYAVGGLAVDLETRDMWDIVKLMGEILPQDKPRYLMGVGTPDDIIQATRLGMDMFDCVLPTRLARHGSVYVCKSEMDDERSNDQQQIPSPLRGEGGGEGYELINLLNSRYREDPKVIDENCACPACTAGFSRAYISHLLRSNEILGLRLATLHNLWQYLNLMRELRQE